MLLFTVFAAASLAACTSAAPAAAAAVAAPRFAATSARDSLIDESWCFFYGPGNSSTFALEAFDDSGWPLVTRSPAAHTSTDVNVSASSGDIWPAGVS